ncbi:MAG: murein L,D-transpeptidase family protein, partial [Bauldia sp.]
LAICRFALIGLAIAGLAACTGSEAPKAAKPVPYALVSKMQQLDMKETSQVFIRIFKESSELEVWKQQRNGQFALLKTFEICRWSGVLGPKIEEGDRQAPEGFYTVTPAQMNPKSSYYLSFNIGYPNAFDRSHNRTGSHLMVHGACSSAGCYSMTDESAGELFALARDSFRGGQTNFQIQALPFRMTAENLARHRGDPNMDFWKMLKAGSDHFELTLKPPRVDVCDRRYVFNADAGGADFSPTAACPAYTQPDALVAALERKQAEDEAAILAAISTMEAKATAEAEAVQVAAATAAEKERRAAERAAQPSLVSQLLSRVGIGGGEEPPPNLDTAPVASVAPVSEPAPRVIASVPVPTPRPAARRAAPPAPVAAPAVAAVAEPPPVAPAALVAEPQPEVGRFVKKKFLWPGEEDPDAPPG